MISHRWSYGILFVAFIALAALMRLIPHPYNFAPIGAMAIFAGFFGRKSSMALLAPFAALLLSDMILGFHEQMLAVYLAFLGVIAVARVMGAGRFQWAKLGMASVTGSVVFFVISNFVIWISQPFYTQPMYSISVAGLVQCFVAALPFFHWTLAGDLIYAAAFAFAFRLATSRLEQTA